jgi:hypothetical protein
MSRVDEIAHGIIDDNHSYGHCILLGHDCYLLLNVLEKSLHVIRGITLCYEAVKSYHFMCRGVAT